MKAALNDPTSVVPLGRNPLQVTRMGLGTGALGGLGYNETDAAAIETIRTAYDAGIRAFDTAPLYGLGFSERILGRALASIPRDSYVLSTKVGRLLRRGGDPTLRRLFYPECTSEEDLVNDFTYDGVMRSFEESMARLKLDRIDIVYIHDPDDYWEEAIGGAYPALEKLRSEGIVRAIGAGMMQTAMLARFAREGDFDCFLVAGRYTLLDTGGLDELLPLCAERGIGVIVGSPYNTGILVDPTSRPIFDFGPAEQKWVERAIRIKEICERHNTPLMAAAIQFPLGHPAVVAVLTGARSVGELQQNMDMMRFPVPGVVWDEIREAGLLPADAPVPSS